MEISRAAYNQLPGTAAAEHRASRNTPGSLESRDRHSAGARCVAWRNGHFLCQAARARKRLESVAAGLGGKRHPSGIEECSSLLLGVRCVMRACHGRRDASSGRE